MEHAAGWNSSPQPTLLDYLLAATALEDAKAALRRVPIPDEPEELINKLYLKWKEKGKLGLPGNRWYVRTSLINLAYGIGREISRSPEKPLGEESMLEDTTNQRRQGLIAEFSSMLRARIESLPALEAQKAEYALERLLAPNRDAEMEIKQRYAAANNCSLRTAERHFTEGQDILFRIAEEVLEEGDFEDLFID